MSEPMGPDQFSAGDNVISADGEKIGTVAAVHMSWLLVEKGIIFVSDFHVPFAARPSTLNELSSPPLTRSNAAPRFENRRRTARLELAFIA